MYICAPEEGAGCPEAGVADGCEPPHGMGLGTEPESSESTANTPNWLIQPSLQQSSILC